MTLNFFRERKEIAAANKSNRASASDMFASDTDDVEAFLVLHEDSKAFEIHASSCAVFLRTFYFSFIKFFAFSVSLYNASTACSLNVLLPLTLPNLRLLHRRGNKVFAFLCLFELCEWKSAMRENILRFLWSTLLLLFFCVLMMIIKKNVDDLYPFKALIKKQKKIL